MSIVAACTVMVTIGCFDTGDGLSGVAATTQSVISQNQLHSNGLTAHRLVVNDLSSHALAIARTPGGALIAGDLEGLEETEDGRELLTYIAQCAIAEGDVLVAIHNSITYWFPGLLGLATEWEHGALSAFQREKVSSCLIAHVNAFGVSVTVSGRMFNHLLADATERTTYGVYEGAFFGQIFAAASETDPVYLYSCQGDDRDMAIARAPMARTNRVCTDGHAGCGDIVALGWCHDVCDTYIHEYGWTDCWADGVPYAHAFSVFLRDEDPE